MTQSDLSRMENGEYKVGLDTLFRILQVFELSMSRFFEEPSADVAEAEEAPSADQPTDAQQLLADFDELDEDARRDVRDFIAFKKIQQQSRQPRWKPEAGAAADIADTTPEADPGEAPIPFARPTGSGRSE